MNNLDTLLELAAKTGKLFVSQDVYEAIGNGAAKTYFGLPQPLEGIRIICCPWFDAGTLMVNVDANYSPHTGWSVPLPH